MKRRPLADVSGLFCRGPCRNQALLLGASRAQGSLALCSLYLCISRGERSNTPPPKLLKNCPHRVRFRLGPASFMTWSPSILPLKRHLFMTGWEGLMASGLALQTGRLKTRPRYQAGPQGGNWAQKQMGPLCRSSKIGGAGAREKLSLQRPLTAREKEPCSGGSGPGSTVVASCPAWAARPGSPDQGSVQGLSGVLYHEQQN